MVKVGFPGGPRLEWYDRNPSTQNIYYTGSGVAPHGMTSRASYTVPTGKKAFVGGAVGDILRRAAAGTVSEVYAFYSIGGVNLMAISHFNNTAGHAERGAGLTSSVALAGTTLAISTIDGSTGGTMNYYLSVAIMEFSA